MNLIFIPLHYILYHYIAHNNSEDDNNNTYENAIKTWIISALTEKSLIRKSKEQKIIDNVN